MEKAEAIFYDPHGVISKQRYENKNLAYEPTPRINLISIANKENWEEVENILKYSTVSSELDQAIGHKRGETNKEIDQED